MRTTEDIGRWGGASADDAAAEIPALATARRLFARLARGLEGEIDRLAEARDSSETKDRAKSLLDTIRTNQKALLAVLEFEARHSDKIAQPGRDVIDLAEAREEINCRLARLA